MNTSARNQKPPTSRRNYSLLAILLLLVVILSFFWRSFLPDYVLFSNDGSLAIQKSEWIHVPEAFIGAWDDLNSLGFSGGALVPDITEFFRLFFGTIAYAKFLAPMSLWFLGAAAFFFFRRAGISAITATLGGLAACLTTAYFSNICWGSIPPTLAFAMDLLALGALIKRDNLPFWVSPALAGFAVGVNVIEGADVGALFSMVIAAFCMYQAIFANNDAPLVSRFTRGVGRTILVAVFAGFMALYAVWLLVGANITGIAGTKQDEQTKAQRYDFATQWSLPKTETLALVVPNLFGCNVTTPGAASYWGGIGTDPSWDRYFASNGKGPLPPPRVFLRHTGRGVYIGSLIVFLALWAAAQSLRKKNSAFTDLERRYVWFWSGLAFVSLLLAWGRHAPFYKIIYQLPYFSTIRNPDKFLHIVTLCTVILFAYAIHGLSRLYLDAPLVAAPRGRFKAWWAKASTFDRRWVVVCIGIVLLSVIGWGVYAAMRGHVEDHLVELQRLDNLRNGHELDAGELQGARDFAAAQVSYSLKQVGWFVLVIAVSAWTLVAIMSGTFAGRRARWAGLLLGIILVGDLGRANAPYIVFWNYKEKYEIGHPEPVIQFLANKPYEHRVAYVLPYPMSTPESFSQFENLYNLEWTQQLFPVYSIPTLDIVQMPRMPEDLERFNNTLQVQITNDNGHVRLDDSTLFHLGRMWQLTATRYLVGPAPLLDMMNQQFDSVPNRFRIVQKFTLGARPWVDHQPVQYSDVEAVPTDKPNTPYALFEDTAVLPRATLFSNWQVVTNDQAVLDEMVAPSFDPAKLVLLSKPLPGNPAPAGSNPDFTNAVITSYKPATIKLEATPTKPSVLMMADKFDPNWHVLVDGKEADVLRCNFLMRGVYLEPGHHEVEFKFRPSVKMFYANIFAICAGFCLLGYAMVTIRRRPSVSDSK